MAPITKTDKGEAYIMVENPFLPPPGMDGGVAGELLMARVESVAKAMIANQVPMDIFTMWALMWHFLVVLHTEIIGLNPDVNRQLLTQYREYFDRMVRTLEVIADEVANAPRT